MAARANPQQRVSRLAPRLQSFAAALARLAARHWPFGIVIALAAALRAVTVLGYRPVEWFNDSYSYVTAAVNVVPETIRPSGYALLLAALEPLHRFAGVALTQHLLGLATGTLVYGVLRVRGVRVWIAALAAVPVLFDGYEIQLEHLVMADTLFMFLITAAVVLLCLRDKPGWAFGAAAGLLLGTSAIVRTDGRPLLVVAAICLIIRRTGWRPVIALVAAGLLPMAAYMGWYHSERGPYAITQGDGAFLYSRAMAFADCAKMNPPARLRPLCDRRPPSRRPPSADYIWQQNPLRTAVGNPWTPAASKLGSDFAMLAVRKQPADYLWTTVQGVGRTFSWNRSTQFPDPATAAQYQFPSTVSRLPSWAPIADLHAYQPGRLTTRVIPPFSSLLVTYQRYVYFRGALLALTMVIGAAWVVAGRRRGAPGLLPWCVAAALIATPPATAGFAYRYVLAAAPCACIAAGMALVRARTTRGARENRRVTEPSVAEPAPSPGTADASSPTSAGKP
ncbi:MAG: phospholipid carrier-dependent glycosyltransferase [Micromonosporaceae bacterium]